MNQYALIAEPDPKLASIYASVAREEGLTPLIVRDGVAASTMLHERGAPVLMVTELSLPRVDGFDLVERLRRSPEGTKTSVLAVSASRELRESATNCRASLRIGAILARAATEDSVRRVVKRLLGTAQDTGRSAMLPAVAAPERAPLPEKTPPANDGDRTSDTEAMEDSGLRFRGNLRALTYASSRAVQKMVRSRS